MSIDVMFWTRDYGYRPVDMNKCSKTYIVLFVLLICIEHDIPGFLMKYISSEML